MEIKNNGDYLEAYIHDDNSFEIDSAANSMSLESWKKIIKIIRELVTVYKEVNISEFSIKLI